MRRIQVTLGAVVALGVAFYVTSHWHRAGERGVMARLERGGENSAMRLDGDAQGPGTATKATSPLAVTARLRTVHPDMADLDIEVTSGAVLSAVHVLAARYDAAAGVEPAAIDTLWVGAVRPGSAQRVSAQVRFGSHPPVRIVVTARSTNESGAIFASSAVVALQPTSQHEPRPAGGIVEYPGMQDTLKYKPNDR